MTQPNWLRTAVRRSAEHAWLLGHVFEQYRRFENKSPEELALRLDCSPETMAWLALCRRPEDSHFAEEIHLIAERFNVDPGRLAEIIRHVDSLDVFAGEEDEALWDEGLQAAAHDRDFDDETDS